MHRIVGNCFKTIAYAMIFVIVWDIVFYMWRVNTLNQRMESLMVSMQQTVSKNNCLTADNYSMYSALLSNLAEQMNGDGSANDKFIEGFKINYGHNSESNMTIMAAKKNGSITSNVNIVRRDMKNVASYGDIMTVEVTAGIYSPVWGFFSNDHDADGLVKKTGLNKITYVYYVPCLKYQTVTN